MSVAGLEIVPWDGEREKLIDEMLQDVEDGIMVLAFRDGMPVTREMARERANNIVCALANTYQIRRAP